jgi:hypothetical protein
MQKISQIKISTSNEFFNQKINFKYKLVDYYNKKKPAIFWGMYRDEDVLALENHNNLCVVIWRGSDAMNVKKYVDRIKKIKNIRHISISSFIKNSLDKNGIISELIPIRPTENIINVKPRGNKLYFYYGKNTEKAWNFYGGKIVDKIKKIIPYEIILATKDTYNENELQKIYEDCFLGLRLTDHDGIANTVCEMGLMGRNCIHNGDIPNSLKYNSIDDIVEIIHKEYQNRNLENSLIANDVYKYLDIGENWLYV